VKNDLFTAVQFDFGRLDYASFMSRGEGRSIVKSGLGAAITAVG